MVKQGRQKPQIKERPIRGSGLYWILTPLSLLVLVLIKIGDGVRWFLRTGFVFLVKIGSWAFLFLKILVLLIGRVRVKRPKIVLPRLPKIHRPPIPKFRLRRPTLPQIKLPFLLRSKISLHGKKISKPVVIFPYHPWIKPEWKWFIFGIVFAIIFIFIPYQAWSWLSSLPHPQLLSVREIPVTTKIFDRNGYLLYEIYAEQNRTPVSLTEIPKTLKEATIAIEDKNFYNHLGFSITGILRATKEMIIHGRLQGGSTITQQLIRSALLTPQPTLSRKIKEIFLSFWAERIYSKDQILEMYFNQVPYGGTAWGVEAAAQMYFGKSVTRLSLAEATFLAGLPSAPSIYSPYGIYPEQGLLRQKEVLRRMVEDGYITKEEESKASAEKLEFAPPKTEIKAPHFVMYVKELLEKKYGPRVVQMGGLRVTTTLDLPLEDFTQQVVNSEVEKLTSLQVGNGAALITNPKTGEILAMIGSKDYFDLEKEGNVNVALSRRQPGSAIKVVNYALALEKGFTAATILDDSPITYFVAGQPPYTPINYDGKFHGKIPLRMALGSSYNVPAVKVLSKLGVVNMIEKGRKMGITSWTDGSRYGLSLTLGGGEVTMLDMARLYGTLANLGKKQELTAILRISDYKGQVLEEFQPRQGNEVVSPGVAFLLADILADNQARTSAFGPDSLLKISGKTVSVKTGTTNNLRDNWAIGFTPTYVVVTWVGNNNNQPMSGIASGITGATPIWHLIMEHLLKEKPDEPFQVPPEIIKTEVCGKTEYFIKGTEKSVSCPPPPSPTPTPSP